MLKMQYRNETKEYDVIMDRISSHVVQIKGNFPVQTDGFYLSRIGKDDGWDYSGFTTVYREMEDCIQFSNDGSVYIVPPEMEPTTEPEPYTPTLEETKINKLYEISMECEKTIYEGVDVELPHGTEHFSLTEKDQINLFGKQIQMIVGADKFEYHQDGKPCKYYTVEEMQKITETALEFVTYHTTYCNALNMWIKASEDMEEILAISYGYNIPDEYQSEVLKDMNLKLKEV